MKDTALVGAIAAAARPLDVEGLDNDEVLDRIVERVGDARFVLLGEGTHGTHEFYRLRAAITRRLVTEKGFAGLAVEGDWPDAYEVNRHVRGLDGAADAEEALAGFQRFPQWMWRNSDVLDLVGWLRDHDGALPPDRRAGFWGLDLYSLHASIEVVLQYLDEVDPAAAERARRRYACFDIGGGDPQQYGYLAHLGVSQACEDQAVAQLVELRARRAARRADEDLFSAEQNARLVASAEHYYRTMFRGRVSSWNLRDTHMADTLDALAEHVGGRGLVVWAHNSHVGDARATEAADDDELTLGQLVRERHPGSTVLIGLTTHTGTVTAASDWGAPAERKRVRPSRPDSYEHLFHRTGVPAFFLPLGDLGEAAGGLTEPRLERAIGVIYRPDTERMSHYFVARLPAQFDAVIHVDHTRALEPLERTGVWERGEAPETYPSGM